MTANQIKELQRLAFVRAEERLRAGNMAGYWSMRIVISRLRSYYLTLLINKISY